MTKPYYPPIAITAPGFTVLFPPLTEREYKIARALEDFHYMTEHRIVAAVGLDKATGPNAGAFLGELRRRDLSGELPGEKDPELTAALEARDYAAVRRLLAVAYREAEAEWGKRFEKIHRLIGNGLERLRKRRHQQPGKDQFRALLQLRDVFRQIATMEYEGHTLPVHFVEAGGFASQVRRQAPPSFPHGRPPLEDIARALVAESSPPGGEPEPPPPPPAAA